jgi:hypothetical protein
MGECDPPGLKRVFFGALGGSADGEPFPSIREIGSMRLVSEIGTETLEYTRN